MADSDVLEVTPRTKVRRFPPRGKYDLETIFGILDKAPMAHISFIKDGMPALLPMTFWRVDDVVYFHGAEKNRMFGALDGLPSICFTATLLDGFVAARDALHHSLNYRCVIAYAEVEQVTDPAEKLQGLKNLIDRFYPERWDKIQPPSQSEFDRVTMYKFPLTEASAKVAAETAPYPEFRDVKVWSGIVPVGMRMGDPISAPGIDPTSVPPQDYSNIEFVTGKRIVADPTAAVAPDDAQETETAKPDTSALLKAGFYAPPLGGEIDTVFHLSDGSTQRVKATVGDTLMVAAKSADVPGIVADCCGSGVCATCHVIVSDDWVGKLPAASGGEAEMLEYVEGGQAGSRLSCQIVVSDDMDGLVVTVPDTQR